MKRVCLIVLSACLLAGCSMAPHAAPLPDAKKINTVTSSISTVCGELDQLTAFPPPPRKDVVTLKATASSAVHQLAAIYRGHPNWRFDGFGMGTIVNQARTMLRGCGLKAAAEQLKRETAKR
jgi:outer membrane murein-binding lipoprotein Lpp